MQVIRQITIKSLIGLIILSSVILLGQGKDYAGPDDAAGDIAAERDAYMTGNRVRLFFRNTTELSDWPLEDASLWPNSFEGTRTLDGIGLLVGARVYLENDTIPIEDPENYSGSNVIDTLYYCQTSYRQGMDKNPRKDVEWGFYPVFGYFNDLSEHPAMSNRPDSWPVGGWPATGDALKWPGEWDGRFGRGIAYADLETYFVVNDAHDQENLGFNDVVRYYPRPGVNIGDKNPDVSIQYGMPWGGIGLRVEQRGFQWNNPQARDAIFWEYKIANISDYDLPEVAFGYFVDTWIGGENESDDFGYFDTQIDMAYCWDKNGYGFEGREPGTLGFAYLESPGLPYNGIDDDSDGLIDEARDNEPVNLLAAGEGISSIPDFLSFYNLDEADLREHWDADEDQDWDDGIDLNGDGNYYYLAEDGTYYVDPGEDPGDDVGLDGVGPGELNYFGPDEGEGNHKPDYVQGIGCEPDFNATDVSESDMVGLTSFRMYNIPNDNDTYHWPAGDKSMWELLGEHYVEAWEGGEANLILAFASGPFPLFQGREERISMAEIHSNDPSAAIVSPDYPVPELYERKRIVQIIYEKDYRFAQPPLMPTLQATAGDGKVILTWDNVSDTKTRDPFMGNINDFEGYKLYRATDKLFSDALLVTDGKGDPSSMLPIFQCDIVDNRSRYAEYGHNGGALFYLGDETGIVHHYVDNNVQNGRTYYYALVAYDWGNAELGISPTENRIILDLDEAENIRFAGKNVQIVTPHQIALGYIPPNVVMTENVDKIGTGSIIPEILAPDLIKSNNDYQITYDIDLVNFLDGYNNRMLYTTSHLYVHNLTTGDSIPVYSETPDNHVFGNLIWNDTLNVHYLRQDQVWYTDVFDGLRLRIDVPGPFASLDLTESNWLTGTGYMNLIPAEQELIYNPWDYEIIFSDNDSAHVSQVSSTFLIQDEQGNIALTNLLKFQSFPFYVINTSFPDSTGAFERLEMIAQDINNDDIYNPLDDRVLVGRLKPDGRWGSTVFIIDFSGASSSDNLPQSGDLFRLRWQRPFFTTDTLDFTILPASGPDERAISKGLDQVKVVPNPYVATNAMEESFLNTRLNQDRKLMFTKIPANCEITIFTASGVLVDRIGVQNEPPDGKVHWDLVSKEGLDIAAGIYIFVIKTDNGDVHKGKFAVIK